MEVFKMMPTGFAALYASLSAFSASVNDTINERLDDLARRKSAEPRGGDGQPEPTRICILGGGFAGVYTAMALERLLKHDPSVEITLVSRDNYLVFQPMLPEVISGSVGILDTVVPIRRLCRRTKVHVREIESIDLANRVVTTGSGFWPTPTLLKYDHLVIALGNVTRLAGQSGLAEHALPFRYLADALVIRNHVIRVLEEADGEPDADRRRILLTFVVAGGGFSGVEAAAELNDFVRHAARSFRNIRREEMRVLLVHSGPVILPELPERLGRFAQQRLTGRGLEIRLSCRLKGATPTSATLDTGEEIPTKTLVSTVPSGPNPLVNTLPCTTEKDRIVVDAYLEVSKFPGVWAVGDCAWVRDAATGGPCPPTAQHATRQANAAAHNIVASLGATAKRPFAFRALGKLGTLGRRSAVAEILGLRLSGFPAWLVWRFVYLMKMPGVDRKVRVAAAWLMDLVLSPDIVQLRTHGSAGVGRERFKAGQEIFRQGSTGDKVYVIVNGEVEVVAGRPDGTETLLARRGPHECFGEMALVLNAPRMATVRARTDVNLLTFDRDAFVELIAHLPPVRAVFDGLIAQRKAEAPLATSAPPDTPGR